MRSKVLKEESYINRSQINDSRNIQEFVVSPSYHPIHQILSRSSFLGQENKRRLNSINGKRNVPLQVCCQRRIENTSKNSTSQCTKRMNLYWRLHSNRKKMDERWNDCQIYFIRIYFVGISSSDICLSDAYCCPIWNLKIMIFSAPGPHALFHAPQLSRTG